MTMMDVDDSSQPATLCVYRCFLTQRAEESSTDYLSTAATTVVIGQASSRISR